MGSTWIPTRSISANTPAERKIDFLVDLGEALLFDLFAEHRGQALQIIGAFSGTAAERHVESAEDDIGEIVLGGGWAQQEIVKQRSMLDPFCFSGEQLK